MVNEWHRITCQSTDVHSLRLQGTSTVYTSADLRSYLSRGDQLSIGGETFTVHATAPFTAATLPLSSYYTGSSVAGTSVYIQDTFLSVAYITTNVCTVTSLNSIAGAAYSFAANTPLQIGQSGVAYQVSTIAGPTSFCVSPVWSGASGQYSIFKRRRVTVTASVTAAAMATALLTLPSINYVDVYRTGPDTNGCYRWTITFMGESLAYGFSVIFLFSFQDLLGYRRSPFCCDAFASISIFAIL